MVRICNRVRDHRAIVKRIDLSDYANVRRGGIIAFQSKTVIAMIDA